MPGTNSGDATDLFQEGLLIPPTKILRRGKMNEDVQNLICANTRTPEVTWGDIRAQVNTNTYGISKFTELFAKHGIDKVQACWQRWMDICETELRKEIAKVPDGRYGPETDYLDDDGVELAKPHRISASLEVKGDTLALHSRQRRAGARTDQPAALRVAQLHRMPGEDDLHPAVAGECRTVAAGEGVLSAGRLAAQSAVSGAGEYVRAAEPDHDLGGDADPGAGRSRAACRRRAAPPAARSAAPGRHPVSGRWYSQYEIMNGGTGARPDGDGVSTMDELVINVMNTPVEAVESEFPVRIERYDLPIDSGGAGTFRGGLGTRRQWRVLADETSVNLRTDRFKFSSPGLFGAKPRAPVAGLRSIRRAASERAADLEGRRPAAQEGRSAHLGIRRRRRLGRSAQARSRARPQGCRRRLRLASKRPRMTTAWRSIPAISRSTRPRPRSCGARRPVHDIAYRN